MNVIILLGHIECHIQGFEGLNELRFQIHAVHVTIYSNIAGLLIYVFSFMFLYSLCNANANAKKNMGHALSYPYI